MSDTHEPHEHTYVLSATVYVREVHRFRSHYFRIQSFFCLGCLDEKELAKREYDQEKAPDWFVTQGCETRDAVERW